MQLDEGQGAVVGGRWEGILELVQHLECFPLSVALVAERAATRQKRLPCISTPSGAQAANVPRVGG